MKLIRRQIAWIVAPLIIAELVLLYMVPGAGRLVMVFPGILLTGAMIVIISIIAGNLKLAHTVNIETPRKNYQVQSNQPSSKETEPVRYSKEPLPEPLIGLQSHEQENPASSGYDMESLLTEIGVFFSTFQLQIVGGQHDAVVSGLEAIQIHQDRMVLFYNDRSAFSGQLAGYDTKIAAHLTSFLRYLEYCHAHHVSIQRMQPLYDRYISPVISGYERLLNRVDYPAAHDALFPIKETGNKIQEYWAMAVQQTAQAA